MASQSRGTIRGTRRTTPLSLVAGSLLSGTEIAEDRHARRADAVYAVLQRAPGFHSLDDRRKLDLIEEILAAAETGI